MLYEGEGGMGNGEDKIISFIQFPVQRKDVEEEGKGGSGGDSGE